ncbi:MAG: glutamate--tRNA ligase [Patescibacteria group bacterium]|uniref:Glutamate--tRNA ligase n=1 Tax=candidate division WWE3 bacterium TaxID=2053526 RepID=A0A955J1M9_UNCKA|nr:glutamate--tRNA ligase [candidate division WWE3 bacterium]
MKKYRFAPSPTGFLHLGHIIGAFFNYSFAQKSGGKYILRIEDTDLNRNQDDSVKWMLEDFKWLGLIWDEGPDTNDPTPNDYFQSTHLDRFLTYRDQLLAQGKAFKAYETPEEREAQIKDQREHGKPPIYSGGHENLSLAEQKSLEDAGRQPVVRLKVDLGNDITYTDGLYGEITVNTSDIGSFTLYRSTDMPMYNFAVVVDDHVMGVTDVVRGTDHVNNTPRQILIYKALGWDVPTFTHYPNLLAEDQPGKLSKRRGAKSVAQYRSEGYLADAIYNYLALTYFNLGIETREDEILTRAEILNKISVENMQKSNPKFNAKKLEWVNGQHIRALSLDNFKTLYFEWLENYAKVAAEFNPTFNTSLVDSFLQHKDVISMGLDLVQTRIVKFDDTFLQLKFLLHAPSYSEIDASVTKHDYYDVKNLILALMVGLDSIDMSNQQAWEDAVRNVADSYEWKHGDAFMALRLALVGDRYSPPLRESMVILGKEECFKRIQDFASTL